MCRRNLLILFGLSMLLLVPCRSTFAQLPGRPNAGRAGTARVQSNPRSGLGFRNNPIANPAPSLTPSEVLNPRGSLSAGQVLNPKPSLNRPRTGGALPGPNTGGPSAVASSQSARPVGDERTTSDDTVLRAIAPAPVAVPAGEQILIAVVALERQIKKVAPDKGWVKRLSLDELRDVLVFSEQPKDDAQQTALEDILKTYQAVAKEDESTSVSSLPEFKQTVEAIQQYLSPLDVRLRQKTLASFQKLTSDLMWYKNGAPWVQYLVPSELSTNDGETPLSKTLLEKQLKRYAKISGDPFYKKVSSLPGFKPAYEAVKSLSAIRSP